MIPALTHRIREAERRLGLVLFTRVDRGLRMTPAAERLVRAAERVFEDPDRAERDAIGMSEGVEHVVRIGIGSYTRYHWLPAFLAVLRKSSPEIQVEIVASALTRPVDMLHDAAVDLAIVAGVGEAPGITCIHLFEDELVAVTPPRHRFAKRRHIEAEAFRDEIYITCSMVREAGFEGERFMRPANVEPKRMVRVEVPDAIVELVRAGMGVSVLSRWAIEPHVREGTLAATRLSKDGLQINWFAMLRHGDGDDSPAHRVASSLAHWCQAPARGFRSVARAS